MKKLIVACALLAFTATACPPADTPTDWAKCPPAPSGHVQVAVVTDNVPASSPSVVCVVVPEGSTGLDALVARSARIGVAAPRIADTEWGPMVCGIDGTPPAPACGDVGPDGTSFWAYWNGGGSWAQPWIGAHQRIVEQGSVDGWTFGTWDFVTTEPTAPAVPSDFATLTGAPVAT